MKNSEIKNEDLQEQKIGESPFDADQETNVEVVNVDKLPTLDEAIKLELKKYDPVVAGIEKWSSEYMPLKIESLDDVEGYERVKAALKFMVNKRNRLEDKRRELKETSVKVGRAIDEKAKELQSLMNPIELHLKGEKERIDAEKQAIEERIQQEKALKIKQRHDSLIEVGMHLLGDEYLYDNPIDFTQETLHKINLETFTDEIFEKELNRLKRVINEAKLEVKRRDDERKLQDAQREEENRRFKQQAEEQARKQKALADEMKQIKEERVSNRIMSLSNIGVVHDTRNNSFIYGKYKSITLVSYEDTYEMSAADWSNKFSEIKLLVEEAKIFDDKKQEEERVENEKREALRLAEQRRIDEENRIRREAELEKIRKEAEEKAINDARLKKEEEERLEKERIANLNDKQKMADYATKILAIEKPELKSAKWIKSLEAFITAVKQYVS